MVNIKKTENEIDKICRQMKKKQNSRETYTKKRQHASYEPSMKEPEPKLYK
jgi:ribosomal protein S21